MSPTGAPERSPMPGLLEREAALDALLQAWDRAREGRFVVVSGPAGIGKSSLLSACGAMLLDRAAVVLTGSGSELERAFPYGVARQLLERPVLALSPTDRGAVLSGPAAPAGAVLGARPPGSAPLSDPAFANSHALHWALGNLASGTPLALLVDDVHWADVESASWLAYTARRIGDLGVLIVVAVRDDEPDPGAGPLADLLASPNVARIALEPLSDGAVQQLVALELGTGDADLASACRVATGGNAFLVSELVRELRRAGTPATAEAVRHLGPPAIARAAVARMARLSPDAVRVGQSLAVIGSAGTQQLTRLTGLSPAAVAAAIDDLARVGILGESRPVAFRHPVVRAAILRELGPMQRAEAHLDAARALAESGADIEAIAAQLVQTEPAGDAWVASMLAEAGAGALGRHAPGSALPLLERALREPPPDDEVAELLKKTALAALALARPDSATRLEEALLAEPDAVAAAGLARILGGVLLLGGQGDAALEVLESAVARLPAQASELGRALELDIWRVGQFGHAARARTQARRPAFAPPSELQASPGYLARDAIESVLTGGTAAEAIERANRALAGGELLDVEGSESPIFQMAANVLLLAGDHVACRAAYDGAIAQSTQRGSRRGFLIGHVFRALANRGLGNLADAEADARVFLEHGQPGGPAHRLAAAALIATLVDRGELEAAAAGLAEHDPQAGEEASAGHLLQARARLAAAQGRHDAALELLAQLAEHESAWGIGTPAMTQWRAHAARSHAARGETKTAWALAAEEVERARRFGAPVILGTALLAAAEVGDPARRRARLAQAVAVIGPSGARLEHARALVELGSELRRGGQRAQSRPHLRAGIELARACGATWLTERGYDELDASGVRQRRILRTGVDALTPSERRVAMLAAGGATNREIAQSLFLSVRTVETHLARTFMKLDVSSRDTLAGALEAGDEPQRQ